MSLTAMQKGKGKALLPLVDDPSNNQATASHSSSSSSSSDSSGSDSDSDSDSESVSDEEVTQEYLESLLEKARQNAAAASRPQISQEDGAEEEIIHLGDPESEQKKLPTLDPGILPEPYIILGPTRRDAPTAIRDLDAERAAQSTSSLSTPTPPLPPPEITKSGVPLTRREKKALKTKTAGSDWFDLPAPAAADLPRLYREVEALRLRNQLDPKRFYRKDEGEGRGIKGLPKYFAIGKVIPTSTPFGGASGDNLARAERKRTLVDELVDDAEARRYAKRKFSDLQGVRAAKGRGTLAAKKRTPKW
ncbi:Fcf2-domain-containing protein [Artomyces pyxidatus]|uniref:Fcf2-domain-containing protein n=1 Tax=Artomyces pyxidatus TaxID=48021 RepID=A0ACB8SJI5_9AGAM|nr:Fcf2-domain-containing protein [Artomyces pyxidatus]